MGKCTFKKQKISLGFRFILNFRILGATHTTENEKGNIELYIKRLKSLLAALDQLNSRGIMIKAVWCIGGTYSVHEILQTRCPDLLEHIRYRVDLGFDEINHYPANEAMLPLLQASELKKLFIDGQHNFTKSGILDLFPSVKSFLPLPGKLYTPSILPYLSELGIEGISFNLSGLDGKVCSDVGQHLKFYQKYNPIWLTSRNSKERTILIPCLSGPDAQNWGGLKKMVVEIREQQIKENKISDLYLLFDLTLASSWLFDNDSDKEKASLCLLEKIISSVSHYPFICFHTPSGYVETHPAKGLLFVDRDIVVGEQGVLIPWADKWESRKIWGAVERSRIFCDKAIKAARETGKRKVLKKTMDFVFESEDHRYSALCESCYGPSFLNQNEENFIQSLNMALQSEKLAHKAFGYAWSHKKETKKVSTDQFKEALEQMGDQELTVGASSIENGHIKISHQEKGGVRITFKDFFKGKNIENRFAIRYGGRLYIGRGEVEYISSHGLKAQMLIRGKIRVRGNLKPIIWQQMYSLQAGVPHFFLNVEAEFPEPIKRKKLLLEEIMPSEFIFPRLTWRPEQFKIWKDSMLSNFEAQLSLGDYFKSIDREQLIHSQVTRNWIAYGSAGYGLLLGQKHSEESSFAFCPVKILKRRREATLLINPLGCYESEKVPRRFESFTGRILLNRFRPENGSSAPSYAGKKIKTSLFVAPFKGDQVPEKLVNDCVEFSTDLTLIGSNDKDLEVTG